MTVNVKRTEWDKENMRTISCRVRKEEAEEFKKYAEYLGVSPHALLSEYVRKSIKAGENVTPEMRDNSMALQNEVTLLRRKLKIAETALFQARERAVNAEALVDRFLRSADGK